MDLYTFKIGAEYPVFNSVIKAKKDSVTGKYLIPAFATEVDVIEDKPGFQRYFKNGAWNYVEDNIGTEYYTNDGEKITINELGIAIPDDALFDAPIIPPTIDKQTKLATSECSQRIESQWNTIGQLNAALGIYSETESESCKAWIAAHRTALEAMLARNDLVDIDVTDDQYWPSVSV